jgi:hypothetical protein
VDLGGALLVILAWRRLGHRGRGRSHNGRRRRSLSGSLWNFRLRSRRGRDRRSGVALRDLSRGSRRSRVALRRSREALRDLSRRSWGSWVSVRRSREALGNGVLNGGRGGLVGVRNLLVVIPLRASRGVNLSEVTLDGMIVLMVLVDTAGHIDVGRVREFGSIIIAGRSTHCSTTASLTARGVSTTEGRVSTEDNGTRATEGRRRRIDVLVLEVNGVVILAILIDVGVGVNGDGSVELLTTIVSGWATHGSATLLMLMSPAALEGSAPGREVRRRENIGVLEINGVVILAVLVHRGLKVASDGLAEANSIIITGWTAHGGATMGVGEAGSAMV